MEDKATPVVVVAATTTSSFFGIIMDSIAVLIGVTLFFLLIIGIFLFRRQIYRCYKKITNIFKKEKEDENSTRNDEQKTSEKTPAGNEKSQ